MSNFYGATSLIDGLTGSLDSIDGTNLVDGDGAIVITDGIGYQYHLNATSGETESSPRIITPDANAGTKRWTLNSNITTTGSRVDVTTFGATGNGVTDDAAAIQAAIDYCESFSLSPLYLPPGTYIINVPLVIIQTRFNIIGSSMWRSVIATGPTWVGAKILDFTGNKSWLSVCDLYIRGPGAVVGSPIGMYFDITVSVELKNILFRLCGTGLDIDGNTALRMENVYATGNYTGAKLAGIRSISSINCVFESSETIGLWMSDVSDSVFINMWMEANVGYGLYAAAACHNNTFIGGYWAHSGTQGITYFENSAHENNVFNNIEFAGSGGVVNDYAANPLYFINCKSLPTVTGYYKTALNSHDLSGSEVWDPADIADGDKVAEDVTVTGAKLGDFAIASFSLDVADLVLNAQVTATNTVTVVLANNTGAAVNLGSGTVYVRVIKR